MTNQNRKSINRTRINKRKSLRNNKKVGGANPTYLYLIYANNSYYWWKWKFG